MKISKVKIKGFRSYLSETTFQIDEDLTAIIGKNDVGKSTVLEALEIFFNSDVVRIDSNDLCIHSNDAIVEISCSFFDFPTKLVIDSSSETSLKDEYLLNVDGEFEIVKQYDCSKSIIKPKVFTRANHPSILNGAFLHELKNAGLKKIVNDNSIDTSAIDLRSNVSLRAAIWDHFQANTQLVSQLVSLEKEDGKKVYEKIKEYLPLYVLFQADRTSRDDDSEVQDPMKIAVKQAIQEVQSELEEVKRKVQEKARESAQRTLKKLHEMNPSLAKDLRPNFKTEPKWDSIFKLSLTDDDAIPINKRGSGTRRLILLNYFRAEAERKKSDGQKPSIIYAIEEPETSQHPDNQKMLINALRELGQKDNCQVLVTTHVPRLAGMVDVTSLRFILEDSTNKKIIHNNCGDGELKMIADTLGVLPDRRVQVILFVEGPNDVEFFERVTNLVLSLDGSLPDLVNDHRIAIFPLGGSTLNQWVNKHYTKDLDVDEVHVYDLDDPSKPKYQDAADRVNTRSDNSCAFLTSKRELENYIHPEAIRREFGFLVSVGDFDDVPVQVAQQLAIASGVTSAWSTISNRRRKKIEGLAKRRLNQGAVSLMTPAELSSIDSNNELINWFSEIKKRLK